MQAPEVLGGRYELRGVLGRGGMAEVRDGWDLRLDRAIAVKLLHPVLSAQPDNRGRFENEARAAAKLNHPHIVAVHDSGEHNATPYIVMERLPGRTLADVIDAGPMPQAQVRSILDDVLSALAAAHRAGILHRDIKPANILFTDFGATKVGDFGIAKTAQTTHTMTGQIVGTMGYLSTDRIAGRPATIADDLYALGVVGYEALTGQRPFPQDNLVQLAHAIADHRPTPLAMVRPDVDPALAGVVERAMARDPRQRFGSANDMRQALAGRPVPAPPVIAAPPVRPPTRVMTSALPPMTAMPPMGAMPAAPASPRGPRKLLGIAAAVSALLLAAVLVLSDFGGRQPVPRPAGTSTAVPVPPATTAPTSPATTSLLSPSSTSSTTTSSMVPAEEIKPSKRRGPRGDGGGD